LNTKYLY